MAKYHVHPSGICNMYNVHAFVQNVHRNFCSWDNNKYLSIYVYFLPTNGMCGGGGGLASLLFLLACLSPWKRYRIPCHPTSASLSCPTVLSPRLPAFPVYLSGSHLRRVTAHYVSYKPKACRSNVRMSRSGRKKRDQVEVL
jgi:hypothetical protein